MPIVAIFNKWIFQFNESILVQFKAEIYVQHTFFWFNVQFCIQHFLHSIHLSIIQCDCFGSTSFFISIAHSAVSTFYFVQRNIYFRSTIYCTAVDRKNSSPVFTEFSLAFMQNCSPPFWKKKQQLSGQNNGSLISFEVVVLPRRSFRACEKDFRRRDC